MRALLGKKINKIKGYILFKRQLCIQQNTYLTASILTIRTSCSNIQFTLTENFGMERFSQLNSISGKSVNIKFDSIFIFYFNCFKINKKSKQQVFTPVADKNPGIKTPPPCSNTLENKSLQALNWRILSEGVLSWGVLSKTRLTPLYISDDRQF